MASSRETLGAALPVPMERVELPEFGDGEYVMCYGMTAGKKQRYDASLMNKTFTGVDRAKAVQRQERLVAQCVRDDNGQRIFSDSDIEMLSEWPADVLNRVYEVCDRLVQGKSTLTEQAEAAAVKNSPETGGDS